METAGYLASVLIGISLGLIGGGGSILTVPVLVYLFKIDAVLATTYSLFVVGTTSFVGAFSYFKNKLIDFKTAFVFGIPSIVGVFLSRKFLLPIIPETIIKIEGFELQKGFLLMLFFAVLMLFASYKMIKKKKITAKSEKSNFNVFLVFGEGLLVGMITGLIGAGGGFLIIPALVGLLKTPMKKAIGTSLFIIAINSVFGFFTSYEHFNEISWVFLIKISSIAMVGMIIGSSMSKKINGEKLKPAFGWFVLIMGIFVIVKELM